MSLMALSSAVSVSRSMLMRAPTLSSRVMLRRMERKKESMVSMRKNE